MRRRRQDSIAPRSDRLAGSRTAGQPATRPEPPGETLAASGGLAPGSGLPTRWVCYERPGRKGSNPNCPPDLEPESARTLAAARRLPPRCDEQEILSYSHNDPLWQGPRGIGQSLAAEPVAEALERRPHRYCGQPSPVRRPVKPCRSGTGQGVSPVLPEFSTGA